MAAESGEQMAAKNVVCFGELLVDFVPTVPGMSLAQCDTVERAAGGAPANVAVAVARLGGKSAMISKVGDEPFGHMLVKMLADNGVDSRGVRFDKEARTALAFVTLTSEGERDFMFYRNPSADMLLQESELDLEVLANSFIFHSGSISLINDPCKSAQLAAMKLAKSSGAILSYDVNLRLALWPSEAEARQGIFSVWGEMDVIKLSIEELEFLSHGGEDLEAGVYSLWKPNLKLVLLTEGRRGCRYYTRKFHGKVETSVQVEAVDTTGAGDAFMGGFLSQLARDKGILNDEASIRKAVEFANACGALTTTRRGAIPALPCQESVLGLVRQKSLSVECKSCGFHHHKRMKC